MIAISHLDSDVGIMFRDKEIDTTKAIVDVLKDNGFSTPNLFEKVHIIIGIVENYCHEVVYHKHDDMDYVAMKDIVINIIISILK